MKSVSNKRTPTVKPSIVNPMMRNPTNATVLAEYKVQIDNPLTPIEVATRRADRIAKEKLNKAVSIGDKIKIYFCLLSKKVWWRKIRFGTTFNLSRI